jgi:alanine racemase
VGPEDAERLVAANVEPMVTDASEISWLDAAAASSGRRLFVHLKVDTGLGRQGVAPEGAAGLAARIAASSHLHLAGTMTHLATAEDPAYTGVQLQRLADVLDATRRLGIDPGLVHFGATGAILARLPDLADAVRPGLGLYGLVPPWADATAAGLRPVLSLRAHPVRVFDAAAGTPIGYGLRWRAERPSRLATLPIGYGDGWPRIHDNNGFALVRGVRVSMVGAISMDGLVVDVTDAGDVGPDDEVVLIGRQDAAEITVDDVARQRGTINYEVTTALRRRLPRRASDR